MTYNEEYGYPYADVKRFDDNIFNIFNLIEEIYRVASLILPHKVVGLTDDEKEQKQILTEQVEIKYRQKKIEVFKKNLEKDKDLTENDRKIIEDNLENFTLFEKTDSGKIKSRKKSKNKKSRRKIQ